MSVFFYSVIVLFFDLKKKVFSFVISYSRSKSYGFQEYLSYYQFLLTACMYEMIDERGQSKRNVFRPYKMEMCGLCLPRPSWGIGAYV